MGQERVEKLKQEFSVEIDYRAFFLRPDIPPEGVERPESYNRPASPVQLMAKEAGLVMNRPVMTPSTRLALEATEYAKLRGVGEEFHMAAYDAYWGEGLDLGKLENLEQIGKGVGLDWSDLSQHLEDRTHRESIEHQYQAALDAGVTGIPAYMLGNFFFTGAQPYELFQQVAERALISAEQGTDAEGDSSAT